MKNRIPPPIYLIVAIVGMWGLSHSSISVPMSIPFSDWFARTLFTVGAATALLAAWQFRRAKTTVDPLKPQSATALVKNGIFSVSRNPMYLGMAVILLGAFIKIESLINASVVLIFVVTINELQIKPEEKALTVLFGKEYTDYCKRVRRWL